MTLLPIFAFGVLITGIAFLGVLQVDEIKQSEKRLRVKQRNQKGAFEEKVPAQSMERARIETV
jgi:hypothetical protein